MAMNDAVKHDLLASPWHSIFGVKGVTTATAALALPDASLSEIGEGA